MDYEEDVVFEYIINVMNCQINTSGIFASLIKIVQIHTLSITREFSKIFSRQTWVFSLLVGHHLYMYFCVSVCVSYRTR